MWFTTLSADALSDMVHGVIVLDMMLAECVRKRGYLTRLLPGHSSQHHSLKSNRSYTGEILPSHSHLCLGMC